MLIPSSVRLNAHALRHACLWHMPADTLSALTGAWGTRAIRSQRLEHRGAAGALQTHADAGLALRADGRSACALTLQQPGMVMQLCRLGAPVRASVSNAHVPSSTAAAEGLQRNESSRALTAKGFDASSYPPYRSSSCNDVQGTERLKCR